MNEDKEIKELEKEDETSEITDKRSKSRIIRGFKKVHKIVNEPSFFPELKRKSKLKRYFENYLWVIKNKRPSFFYNQFGLDIKNFRNADDFISTAYVKKERAKIHHKGHPLEKTRKTNINTRYSIIADNKNIFYTYDSSLIIEVYEKSEFK